MKPGINSAVFVVIAIGLFAISYGCSSSSTDPLTSFSASACKKENGQSLKAGVYGSVHQPLTTDTAVYDGLTCISWDATGTTLKTDLINFSGGCSIEWQGSAETSAGNSLTLHANHEPKVPGDENTCMYAACGWCIYDWAYEVKGLDLSKDSPAEIVSGLPCDKSNVEIYNYTFPLASAKTGVVCDYMDPNVLAWISMGSGAGKLHMPCRDVSSAQGHCNTGLACTKMTSNSICLKTCAQDSDCPLPDLLKCTDGLCRLVQTW
jgi:hypothetical protein